MEFERRRKQRLLQCVQR